MKTIIIDASSLLFPTIYNSTGFELTTEDGTPVTCVYSFLEDMLSLGLKFSTNRIVVVFDSKGSKRRELYPDYKANRQEVSEEIKEKRRSLFDQIPILKDFLTSMKIPFYCEDGLEADDLVASIVYNNPLEQFITVSTDHDLLQLIRENNVIYNPKKETIIDDGVFRKKFPMISASEYWKILSLAGCSTDNVKPCNEGVGEKTAYKYLTNALKPTSKAYQKVVDGLPNTSLIEKLVKLPFEGTPQIQLPHISLRCHDFFSKCTEYQFVSFLEEKELNRWVSFFSLR